MATSVMNQNRKIVAACAGVGLALSSAVFMVNRFAGASNVLSSPLRVKMQSNSLFARPGAVATYDLVLEGVKLDNKAQFNSPSLSGKYMSRVVRKSNSHYLLLVSIPTSAHGNDKFMLSVSQGGHQQLVPFYLNVLGKPILPNPIKAPSVVATLPPAIQTPKIGASASNFQPATNNAVDQLDFEEPDLDTSSTNDDFFESNQISPATVQVGDMKNTTASTSRIPSSVTTTTVGPQMAINSDEAFVDDYGQDSQDDFASDDSFFN